MRRKNLDPDVVPIRFMNVSRWPTCLLAVVLLSACEFCVSKSARFGHDGTDWEPTKRSPICSVHFVGGAPSKNVSFPSYMPVIFPEQDRKRSRLLRLNRSIMIGENIFN